jgi:hypothetical protein
MRAREEELPLLLEDRASTRSLYSPLGYRSSAGIDKAGRWSEVGRVLILLLLTGAIHAWIIRHTELPARDGVGFMHYAWRLLHEPWDEVLRTSHQHPGYPLLIAAASRLWPLGDAPLWQHMLLSAQFVNLAAGCLLAVAMFCLGKELFNSRVGFWTAAVFQCLPVAARVMSDALSEATFLLTSTIVLLLAVRSLRGHSIWRMALCGACGGLCFLIRPEGTASILAVLIMLLGRQGMVRWRQPWRQVIIAAATFTVTVVLVAGPYVLVLGHFTNKPTGQAVIGLAHRDSSILDPQFSIDAPVSSVSRSPLLPLSPSVLWAVWWHGEREGDWPELLAWGAWAVIEELVRGFAYVGLVPALFGLFWFGRQWRKGPEIYLLVIVCLLQVMVLCRVGLVVGYVSERHILIVVLCGLYWAVWATLEAPKRLQESKIKDRLGSFFSVLFRRSSTLGASLLVIFMLACLPVCLQPLHANQVGHREAGLWLAQNSRPSDIIVDPFDWSAFYAGAVFRTKCDAALTEPPGVYVVLEATPKPHPELILLPLAKELAVDGQTVFDWRPNQHELDHKAQAMQVFRVPASSLSRTRQ